MPSTSQARRSTTSYMLMNVVSMPFKRETKVPARECIGLRFFPMIPEKLALTLYPAVMVTRSNAHFECGLSSLGRPIS